MTRTSRLLCALLLRCYPASYRARCGNELETAMQLCVARERRRAGAWGVAYAWLRLAVDALSAGAGCRLDDIRRQRRSRRGERAGLASGVRTSRQVGEMLARDMLRDVWHAGRTLRRAPGFASLSGFTLALGIGTATCVFTVAYSVLVKPLPYPDAASLVSIWNTSPLTDAAGQVPLSATQFFTYRDENRAFAAIGLWSVRTGSVTAVAEPEEVQAVRVTHGALQALGVPPAIGRWFSHEEDSPGAAETVILSNGYWQRRFGGSTSVIGRTLILDARLRTIIGVMPAGFRFVNESPDLIIPFQFDPSSLLLGAFNYFGIGRLRPGVTAQHASADLTRMNRILLRTWPSPPGSDPQRYDRQPIVRPLKEQVVGDTAGVLWVLSGMVGLVMLISWANVASVSLVQAEQRRHDVVVRLALGAASHRLARELLLESGLLGALAGALGVSLAFAAVRVLVALAPASLPRVDEIGIGPVELAFALTLAILSSLLLGAIQVVRHLGPTSEPSLHVTDRTSSGSRAQQLTRNSLVVAQVSLALVLVVGAGLMVRTFLVLRAVQPGFTTSTDIQLARITIPVTVAEDPERVFRMQRDIVDRLSALPGVVAASLSSAAPMEPFISANTVLAEHQGDNTGKTRRFKFVSPGYFTTVGTPLVAGREFTWDDLDQRRPVAVISENMAREVWQQPEAAVGRRIRENPQGPWRDIIGVVSNVFDDGVDAPPPAIAYWPALLDNFEGDRVRVRRSVTLIVRSNRAGTEGLLNDVQRTVWSVNSNLPLSRVRTLRTLYDGSLARTSFTLVMLAIAASMALLFGSVGIYGTIAYAVAQRTREIGIRLALGAPPRDVRRMFIRQGVVLAGLGVAIGAVAATALTRLMSSLLFGVSAIDPGTYLVASLGLLTAASIASYIPAQRATAVDPVRTLRPE